MTYQEWAARWPQAAAELANMATEDFTQSPPDQIGKSESWAQQKARFNVGQSGAFSWRNNVGATKTQIECHSCGALITEQPVRYGLGNDSQKLNEKFKSSDLILAIPRRITPDMVNTTIAQFGSLECKRPGWVYTGKGQEPGQLNWISLINRIGGYAAFSTGEFHL